MIVWIVGRLCEIEAGNSPPRWEVMGVYGEEPQAVARCRQTRDFVAPIEMGVDAPEAPGPWPGLYFPLAPSP